MIAVDTSALVAVVFGEPDAESIARRLGHEPVIVSAATILEAAIVLHARQGEDAVADLRLLLDRLTAEIAAVDAATAWTAHAAWERFGKGRHPAALNFGDCFSYALAKSLDVPLLFKGQDFEQTDLVAAP